MTALHLGAKVMPFRWAEPQVSRGKVDTAGKILISDEPFYSPRRIEAEAIINNWRSSHSYPLHAINMTLRSRAKRIQPDAIVAQRLKRLSSIDLKLRLHSHMKLSQMQDIGGCRAVLTDSTAVEQLVEAYKKSIAKSPQDRPEFIEEDDYIAHPKKDGYRSHHLIYKYRTKSAEYQVYSGLRIEIQIRSRLQHAWATAVETVSTFTNQALKSNIGDDDWKRFFALVGTAIARRERGPLVPGMPASENEVLVELRDLVQSLNVEAVLSAWSHALQVQGTDTVGSVMYLLVLDPVKRTLTVDGFPQENIDTASDAYLAAERANEGKPGAQAVLVSADSMGALRSAYPNYYLDTSAFLDAVKLAISRDLSDRREW